jgi:two-component system osmolarity sensor histidine kinase EnvZ
MLKSLRSRNIALLIIVVVLGQLLSFALVYALAIRPQAERVGNIMGRNVAAISIAMDSMSVEQRTGLIKRINAGSSIRILDGNQQPPEDRGIPTLLERLFVRGFAQEMRSADVIIWRGGQKGQLWAYVRLGGQPYWVSYERPKGWTPNGAVGASFLIAVTLALIGGVLLQRRIANPLKSLAHAADAMRRDAKSEPLPTDGPSEIAAVARSFNLMTDRMAAQETERNFMLAGLSHDLRTPLAKIRLALALIPQIEADTEAMLNRQLDRMDEMLAQFLDFARGVDAEPLQQVDLLRLAQKTIRLIDEEIAVSADAEYSISLRPVAVGRAISNLVRNAILHGAQPIAVNIMSNATQVIIEVTDSGPGVPPEMFDSLDQPFVRVDASRGAAGGSGLGLAIVRHVADSHGGTISFGNRDGGGFAASISLPKS